MTRSVPVGEVRLLGDHALVVGVPDAPASRALTRLINGSGRSGLREVVGGLATVMVLCGDAVDVEDALPWLAQLAEGVRSGRGEGVGDGGNLVPIPCAFDGPDLADVAEAAGCAPEDVIEALTAHPLVVDVLGFSPGFAYLSGLPPLLRHIPRRPQPRPKVVPGSVALANGYAAVYPTASPGGWQLIGRTDEVLFTTASPPYARLAPGDRVQFVRQADPTQRNSSPAPRRASEWAPPSPAVAVFVVEEPGLRTVVQDGGRRGLAALGVPWAGPADPTSFQLANRLVGNDHDAGALEITARGPGLRCLADTYVAVVGAAPDAALDDQPLGAGQVVPVRAGQRVTVAAVQEGLRTYLAVAGGLVGPAILGSMASDQLSGLGPGEVTRGALLWAMPMHVPLGDHVGSALPRGQHGDAVTLRVVPGPHPEWFEPGALDELTRNRFVVGNASNRVGLRLQAQGGRGPCDLGHASAELDSQGMVTGAVQIPPDGNPVVLLPDHATLGGYPVLAVVAAADHGLLGQCAPGSVVEFAPIDHREALLAWVERRRMLERAVVGHYPLAVE